MMTLIKKSSLNFMMSATSINELPKMKEENIFKIGAITKSQLHHAAIPYLQAVRKLEF
jgi:hypothetical protein